MYITCGGDDRTTGRQDDRATCACQRLHQQRHKIHMGKVYWIRHAEKAYKNGRGTPLHDPPLLDTTTPIILNIEEPSCMILSPYLRTRQTAQRLMSGLGKSVRVELSVDIAEYLGHWSTVDVNESTICPFLPPPRETMNQLRARCRRHISSLRRILEHEHDPSTVIWVITHGIVIDIVKSIIAEGAEEQAGECLRVLKWEV